MECALKQSAEAGIKTRSKEYAAMVRKMTPDQENASHAQFRQDRAKEQYALAKKSRVEKQSCKEADADIGEYKVLAKIVEDEGFANDAPGAFRRAQSITSQCAQPGGEVGSLRHDAQRARSCTKAAQPHFRARVESFHYRNPQLCDVDFHGEARLHFDCHGQARWRGDRVLEGAQNALPRKSAQRKMGGPKQRW